MNKSVGSKSSKKNDAGHPNSDTLSKVNSLFDYAPISLWEEDFSPVKQKLDRLRADGITGLAGHLDAHPQLVDDLMASSVVLNVNRKTLEMFGASSQGELIENLPKIFGDKMRPLFRETLLYIWDGKLFYEHQAVNYSLKNELIDINFSWSVLPGNEKNYARVLVAITEITDRKRAERGLAETLAHYKRLFEHSPVSLWEEDFSLVKQHLDRLRTHGVKDIQKYMDDHPGFIDECMDEIIILDVNQRTLDLYGARTKPELLEHQKKVFRDEMRQHFQQQLVNFWNGKLDYEQEGVNYTLSGDRIEINLHLAVMPEDKDTFSRVLVSIEDITARKRADAYLKYLGTHDVLTGLYNRAFFEEERYRLELSRHFPVSIVIADLDGLKAINDFMGHAGGDDMLRRAAEVLKAAFRIEDVVARIGGDEYAVLLPDTDAEAAEQGLLRIRNLISLNNSFYHGPPLSLSIGVSTGEKGASLLEIQREADDLMYKEKKEKYRVKK
jgi:diguanylate cyclase (GGDEF)-like protein